MSARRRAADPAAINDEELLEAHDLVYASRVRHSGDGALEFLADALLRRGHVPEPDAYDGKWWLWWPKSGRGVCQRCGLDRAVKRYANQWGKPYRYLCQRCRKQELADDSAELDRVTGVVRQPGESPQSLLFRRMEALLTPQVSLEAELGESEWEELVEDLEELLSPLAWAGWDVPEEYDSDVDPRSGPSLFGTLRRTSMAVVVEYNPEAEELRFQPFDDVTGDEPFMFSMLEDEVRIPLTADAEISRGRVAEKAGELGFLDATRLRAAEGSDVSATELISYLHREWIFTPAREYRQIPMEQLLTEVNADETLSLYLRFLLHWVGNDVVPDLVPGAAALGIAAWCWRNDTAVEGWHVPTDVLMARVNIAVTRAVQPHVDPVEGVDWQSVEAALTDPSWALPRSDHLRAVRRRLAGGPVDRPRADPALATDRRRPCRSGSGPQAPDDRRIDQLHPALVGARPLGSDMPLDRPRRIRGRVRLPPPYDRHGVGALLADLADPDLLADDVLDWIIDMPGEGEGFRRGLRHHPEATDPVVREFFLHVDGDGV